MNFATRPLLKGLRRALLVSAALGLFVITAHAAENSGQPGWFPKKACAAIGDGDSFRYDHASDASVERGIGNRGYSGYEARVARQNAGLTREKCFKEWTVLVYMAADNDLSPYALWDLYEMEGAFASGKFAASSSRSDLVVETDLLSQPGVRRLHMFQRPGTQYVKPTRVEQFANFPIEKIQSPIVAFQREPRRTPSKDHARRLADFLRWGMRKYPAKQYFVIVWGHGQGWAPDSPRLRNGKRAPLPPLSDRFGGMAFTELADDYLGIPSLSEVLRRVTRDTLENKRKIDVYASDACLMQMAEVAYEISDSTRFIVGSPQMQTLLGLPYRQLMYELNTGRFLGMKAKPGVSDEAHALAKMLPQLAMRSLDPRHGDQGKIDKIAIDTFTMSAIHASELRQRLVPALDVLAKQLIVYLRENPTRSMDLQMLIGDTPSFMGGSRDLGAFLGLLEGSVRMDIENTGQPGGSSRARATLQAILNAQKALAMTTIEYGYGPGYRKDGNPLHLVGFRATGIWLPGSQEELDVRLADFRKSRFYGSFAPVGGTGAWEAWLKALYTPSF